MASAPNGRQSDRKTAINSQALSTGIIIVAAGDI